MFRNPITRLAPMALLSLLAASCGQVPTQPVVDDPGAGVQAPAPQSMGVTGSAKIHGEFGGSLSAGMFTIIVSPGTYDGNATITINQPDPNVPMVTLDITPANKNHFNKPVTLVASLPNLDGPCLAASQVAEFDPNSGNWLDMNGEHADTQVMTLSAQLMHFSTYRVDVASPGSGGAGQGGRETSREGKLND